MKRDANTYGRIERQYEAYAKVAASKPKVAPPTRALPAQRPYVPEPEDSTMGRTVAAAIGIGIGVILLILAAIAFATAAKWSGLDREGAAVGYTLVGFFLTLAGVGGILATYNHNFRVLTGKSAAHH